MVIDGIDMTVSRKAVKAMRLTIKANGSVWLSLPFHTSDEEAERFVRSRHKWITATVRRLTERYQPKQPLTNDQKRRLIAFLKERVEYWRKEMGEVPVVWKLRRMKTQWGNCKPLRRPPEIVFNIELARLPDELTDYVIVHELCHIRIPRHGAVFHNAVARYLPDEKERRLRLKSYTPL